MQRDQNQLPSLFETARWSVRLGWIGQQAEITSNLSEVARCRCTIDQLISLVRIYARFCCRAYDSCDGLKFVLVGRWKEIIEERDVLLKKVDDLIKRSGEEDQFFQECADCHLRSGHTLKK